MKLMDIQCLECDSTIEISVHADIKIGDMFEHHCDKCDAVTTHRVMPCYGPSSSTWQVTN